jgi:anthraniloyl-CoA monooxygenase
MDAPLAEDNWQVIGPSPVAWSACNQVPREMTRADMDTVTDDFVRAAHMAARAGFDLLELHFAHGYLLSAFITPLTNRRADAYGGSLLNRMRFPLEVYHAVRAAWPASKPMSVRFPPRTGSARRGSRRKTPSTLRALLGEAGSTSSTCRRADVGGGAAGTAACSRRRSPIGFATRPASSTMAVGNIYEPDHVNSILMAGRADLCCSRGRILRILTGRCTRGRNSATAARRPAVSAGPKATD